MPITKNDPIRYLGQASLLTLSQKNRAHVEIRTSKPRHSITLMVNGEPVSAGRLQVGMEIHLLRVPKQARPAVLE